MCKCVYVCVDPIAITTVIYFCIQTIPLLPPHSHTHILLVEMVRTHRPVPAKVLAVKATQYPLPLADPVDVASPVVEAIVITEQEMQVYLYRKRLLSGIYKEYPSMDYSDDCTDDRVVRHRPSAFSPWRPVMAMAPPAAGCEPSIRIDISDPLEAVSSISTSSYLLSPPPPQARKSHRPSPRFDHRGLIPWSMLTSPERGLNF
jgi:hypothetical protein